MPQLFPQVKVNPQTFFNFCSRHVSLLRALAEISGELSDTELMRLIKLHPSEQEELPQTVWRNLRELQILVPAEPGSDALAARRAGRTTARLPAQ